jgi:hypothetical protein
MMNKRWIHIHYVLWAHHELHPKHGSYSWNSNGEHTYTGNSDIFSSYRLAFMKMARTIAEHNGKLMKTQFKASIENLGDSCVTHNKIIKIVYSCDSINFDPSSEEMTKIC